MNSDKTGLRAISIYLGNVCNFNCTYCDRDYIKDSIGGQHMTTDDIPKIIQFLREIDAVSNPPEMFTFHGGEPFTYVKIMDKALSAIADEIPGEYMFFIQTNGSQLKQHEWFFKKWGHRLGVSISYDFLYQDLNRSAFDLGDALTMMKTHNVNYIQFQYVMPIHDPRVFSLAAVKSITDICFKHKLNHINLIPLRHIRGQDKFRVILDEIDINQFFAAFIKFIHVLYVMGIDVVVDGHGTETDKHYFDNHKQMVLSPDGYIYPEYDFLEYKRLETTLGRWKDGVELSRIRVNGNDNLRPACTGCPSMEMCGLKYLFKIFEKDPINSNCVEFYRMLTMVIKHAQKLKQKSSVLEWVGI